MESKIKLGKEYNFVGCRWVPVKFIDEEKQIVVMQSLGVTVGPWPGFSMGKFGNGDYYNRDITRRNISDYDDKTRVLMEQIRPIVSGDAGLYLPSYDSIKTNSVWRNALAKAAANYRSFGASYHCAWTGTYGGSSNYAWIVDSDGCTYNNGQSGSYVVPAAFNLDLSKVAVTGDKIAIIPENTGKGEPEETNFILLLRLLEAFTPVCHGILSNDEIQMIQKYLCIQNRSVISLRNLRDFVVLFLADKADIERRNGNNEEFFRLMDIQSGIVSVIDQQIWNLSGEA